jgi:hypothetical protein
MTERDRHSFSSESSSSFRNMEALILKHAPLLMRLPDSVTPRNYKPLGKVKRDLITSMVIEGLSCKEIAIKTNVNVRLIQYYEKKHKQKPEHS